MNELLIRSTEAVAKQRIINLLERKSISIHARLYIYMCICMCVCKVYNGAEITLPC